ncbi:uncharacterized protein LOC125517094 [Triticum urartu]|uniref:uncharacterized protein LOC125517094 n=1 Tax=Triticum urartu TaxID=4572 RepID=UPI002043789A|nr:uncharacterized protein LOC125517094 [Triticum urartu]
MWLQPLFFSIAHRHFGQTLVLASIQFAVSESDLFFASHARTVPHDTGRWASSPQLQQKPCLHLQNTSRPRPRRRRGHRRRRRSRPGPGTAARGTGGRRPRRHRRTRASSHRSRSGRSTTPISSHLRGTGRSRWRR